MVKNLYKKEPVFSDMEAELFSVQHLPARLRAVEARILLGITEIFVLIKDGCLSPLGEPAKNGPKYFALDEVLELRNNETKLEEACGSVRAYFKERNTKKKKRK